ncbi:lysophospholipid acyltransferase family protein [Haliea sp. E1-2-M8]|uniref:lysophospholipid acyltransferase family protein n=1 Tax=Haliea sp. E1-2-M8 TaxID=3064706 RepID=UPI0027218D14|nr:lysophospholipid acyltransferase family protein [Haliea sp. E1-2-M8]MDO8861116.1 lysophospholipid acyltransferase family protein [Haliea sp. E1-2-M8]
MRLIQRVNYLWRLFATALAFSLFGIGGVIVPLISTPVLYLIRGDEERRRLRARRIVHWLFKIYIYMLRFLGILTWTTDGLEKLDRDGLLVLANHPTLIDVVFLVAFVPDANCIVKGRLLANPAMRGLISQAGYITNDQGGKLIDSADASLKSGGALLVFPEGTRTRPGSPLAFQRGAANVAIRCQVDITPVVIRCHPPTLSKQHKWYHIPDQSFIMSFSIGDDIAIAPFLDYPAAQGARQLTRFLEHFFTEETTAYAH